MHTTTLPSRTLAALTIATLGVTILLGAAEATPEPQTTESVLIEVTAETDAPAPEQASEPATEPAVEPATIPEAAVPTASDVLELQALAGETGWVQRGANWFYKKTDGTNHLGWLHTGGYWYYLSPATGGMHTGWQKIGGSDYYFEPASGRMVTGWVQLGSYWYLFASSGAATKGWAVNGGTWYFFDKTDSRMKTAWITDGGKNYLLAGSGAMLTGWQQTGGEWVFLKPSGEQVFGWHKSGNDWYYLGQPLGRMLTGVQIIEGKVNQFAMTGAWLGTLKFNEASNVSATRVLELINNERATRGLSPLKISAQLNSAAAVHSTYQATTMTLTHNGNGGPTVRITATGYVPTWSAELITNKTTSPEAALATWMNSSVDRAYVLRSNARDLGLAIAVAANGEAYWTLLLATPK